MEWWVLNSLQPEARRALVSTLRRRVYRRGEVVFHEGDPAETLHLIVSGHMAAHVSNLSGEPVTVAVLGGGECIGELALTGPGRMRAATMTALDSCETLSLSRSQFDGLRSQSRHLDQFLVLLLAARIERLDRYLLEALYTPADARVARRLLELCPVYRGSSDQVKIPLTQDALAQLSGTTRPTVNQALQQLARKGAVELRRGSITVLDEPLLGKLCQQQPADG